ncbi:MAG: SHOCT domain-containing protein [Pseudonocardiaceae bacterium]
MGLLKTAAKVAVASSVHGRIQRRQQARWAAQDQASASAVPAPPPPAPHAAPAQPQQASAEPAPPPPTPPAPAQTTDMSGRLAQLKQLGELLSAGVLTQAEFEQQKIHILNG